MAVPAHHEAHHHHSHPHHEDPEIEIGTDEIPPEEDVFSYFLLVQPREKKRAGGMTYDSCLSLFLVYLVLGIQAVLLYCVYVKVVVQGQNWRDGIMNTGESWNLFAPKSEGCSDGGSLCTMYNNSFTCAPPSVQLSGRWDELDLDGDGVWTREEVTESRPNIKCHYVVDPIEAFDVFHKLIMNRKDLIWIHPDVEAGKAIPKAYFNYAMGDIIMCGYRNEAMCGNLLKRGFFDAPLKYGTAPRVGRTIDTAMAYCRTLLEPRGTCEQILPSTYSTWKIESMTQCDKAKYSKFVYTNPRDGNIKSLLSVDYKARQRYENAKTPIFQIYKASIVGAWILIIISQLRGVIRTMTWVITAPGEKEEEPETNNRRRFAKKEEEDEEIGIDMEHRFTAGFVTFIRMWMMCVLMYVGLQFLARQTDYIGLLMDGIALIFIIEVAEIVYARVLRHEVKDAWASHDSLQTPHIGLRCLNESPGLADIFWLVVVMIAAAGFLWHLRSTLVNPLYDALNCACLSQGEDNGAGANSCREASAFDVGFWSNYWRYEVPSVLETFDKMKVAHEEGATNLFHMGHRHHHGHHYNLAAN